jgi:hypothetical protein
MMLARSLAHPVMAGEGPPSMPFSVTNPAKGVDADRLRHDGFASFRARQKP